MLQKAERLKERKTWKGSSGSAAGVVYDISRGVVNIHGNMTDIDIRYLKLYSYFNPPLWSGFISSDGRADVHVLAASPLCLSSRQRHVCQTTPPGAALSWLLINASRRSSKHSFVSSRSGFLHLSGGVCPRARGYNHHKWEVTPPELASVTPPLRPQSQCCPLL